MLNSRLTSSPAGLLQRQPLAVYAAKGFGAGKTKKAGKVGRQPVLTCRAAAAVAAILGRQIWIASVEGSYCSFYLQDESSSGRKGGRRVAVQPPAPSRPQVPAGLDNSLQQFDDLEAARK